MNKKRERESSHVEEIGKDEVWERTSQVVVEKRELNHSHVGKIALNTAPFGSARIRRKVPVGVVGPESAASGGIKANQSLLLIERKETRNGKKQGGKKEQPQAHGPRESENKAG